MGIGPLKRAVFLDRDGVLNEAVIRDGKPYPPATAEEVQVTPGAAEALQRLKARGLPLIVVTNQPDVARGTQSAEAVEAIGARLKAELPLNEILVCAHDGDACNCRKPKPGLILEGAAHFGVDLAHSFMVGDRWRDVEAGQAAGCRTVWIDRGYRERGPTHPADARVASLGEAVDWIIGQIDLEANGSH
jgi:D-glycero-D-manno-heptose 1,7-bisphosphate phosphatase